MDLKKACWEVCDCYGHFGWGGRPRSMHKSVPTACGALSPCTVQRRESPEALKLTSLSWQWEQALLVKESFRQLCSQPTGSWDLNLPKCFGAWKSTVAIRKVAALIKSPKGKIHVHFFPSFYKHKGDQMHKIMTSESSKRSQKAGLRFVL